MPLDARATPHVPARVDSRCSVHASRTTRNANLSVLQKFVRTSAEAIAINRCWSGQERSYNRLCRLAVAWETKLASHRYFRFVNLNPRGDLAIGSNGKRNDPDPFQPGTDGVSCLQVGVVLAILHHRIHPITAIFALFSGSQKRAHASISFRRFSSASPRR